MLKLIPWNLVNLSHLYIPRNFPLVKRGIQIWFWTQISNLKMFLRCCLCIVVTGEINQEQILHPKGTFWLFKAIFDVSTTHLSGIDPNFYFISPKGWRVVPARQTGQNQEYFGYNPRYRNIASKLSHNLSFPFLTKKTLFWFWGVEKHARNN